MSLIALPAEITLNIAELLDPESTLSFALTCTSYSSLCKDALQQHRRRLSEWQVIDTTDAATLLWQNLRDILDDVSKGWYVRELNLPPSRQYSWIVGESLPPHHPKANMAPSRADQELFKIAARKLRPLYPVVEPGHILAREADPPSFSPARPNDLIGTIEDRIDEGLEDGIVAIILHYLPNLSTIRLTKVDGTSKCLELTMHRIAGAYKDPTCAHKLPLQCLTTAVVSYCNTEGCNTPDWACSFLSVPSLRTFAASEMGGSLTYAAQACYTSPGPTPFSNVTELFFTRCHFELDGLGVILSGIKNLKELTYYGGSATVDDAYYEPSRLIQTIEKHTCHSLERLILDQEDMDPEASRTIRLTRPKLTCEQEEEDKKTVSLRKFQVLKSLNCAWYMLRPEPEDSDDEEPLESGFYRTEDHMDIDTDFDVRTILPESLEELYISGTFFHNDDEYEWQAIERAFCAPSAMTPRLAIDKTCIRKRWNQETREQIGTATEPVEMYTDPRHDRFFDGHGFGFI